MRGWLTLLVGFSVGALTFYLVSTRAAQRSVTSEKAQQETQAQLPDGNEGASGSSAAPIEKRPPPRPQAPPADHKMSEVPGYLITPESPLPSPGAPLTRPTEETVPTTRAPAGQAENQSQNQNQNLGGSSSANSGRPGSQARPRSDTGQGSARPSAERQPPGPIRQETARQQVAQPDPSQPRESRTLLLSPERPRPYDPAPASQRPAESRASRLEDPAASTDQERLLLIQERYLGLGWRKFISVNADFIIWVPGQLYFYLYGEPSELELYLCEDRDVLYGVQYRRLGFGERPTGSGDSRRFLLEQAQLWSDQYLNERPGLQVDTHSFQMQDTLGRASMRLSVRGNAGTTQVRIVLLEDGILWLWTAYRRERAASDRLQLLLESLYVLPKSSTTGAVAESPHQ